LREAGEGGAHAVFGGNRHLGPAKRRLERGVVHEAVLRQLLDALRIERQVQDVADSGGEAPRDNAFARAVVSGQYDSICNELKKEN